MHSDNKPYLTIPGETTELSSEEAELFGVFEEDALSETDALEAIEEFAP